MDARTATANDALADGPEAQLARAIAAAPDGSARDAEARLYRLLAPRVRRYGQRHLRDDHGADDLVQHVMALAIEKLRAGEIDAPERIVSFVLGVCRLTVIDQRRAQWRREQLLQRHAHELPLTDEAHVAPRLDHQRVAHCLERLPERERAVLVMSFYDEQPADAVGRALGLSAGNVRVIRHRGIDKLRRCVDGARRAA
ncbi:MAG TPA: sigma-70 family RNA polymerase sigma factor [Burkholderiaceae bacterium]|nr:sigma-70 family RNA polymerase sigma factor [Burkholderiaceae bacterium]